MRWDYLFGQTMEDKTVIMFGILFSGIYVAHLFIYFYGEGGKTTDV